MFRRSDVDLGAGPRRYPAEIGPANLLGSLLVTTAHNPLPLLAAAVLCLLGLGLAIQATELVPRVAALPSALAAHWRGAALGVTAAGLACSLVVVWALRAFPNSADEYAFLFEADTFRAGRLWNPLPPLHKFFTFLHILELDGKWAALYPPGWPLLLAAVRLFNFPYWLACPLAGIVLLVAVFKLGERQDGPLGGILALSFVALSPFFLFNAGSYFTQVPAAAAGALFCWMAMDFLDNPRFSRGFLAGVALGMLGLIATVRSAAVRSPFPRRFRLASQASALCSRALDRSRWPAVPRRLATVLQYHNRFDATKNSERGNSPRQVWPVPSRRQRTFSYAS